jgi:hypothetical protein
MPFGTFLRPDENPLCLIVGRGYADPSTQGKGTPVPEVLRDREVTWERTLESGIIAGILAAVPMTLYALIASAAQTRGFYTPLYHVAFLLEPETFRTALKFASGGQTFYFDQEPFVFGMVMRVGVGGFFGAIFGLIARKLKIPYQLGIPAGLLFGFIVMLFMTFAALPMVASLLGSGPVISNIVDQIGWTTLAVEHALFGAGLGLWVMLRPQDSVAASVGLRPTIGGHLGPA